MALCQTSRNQCEEPDTGQTILDLKKNNEFSGLKQIKSMKNQCVHNDTLKKKVIENSFITI